MKRNISVFILLILLASSFKYRTKTRASAAPVITAGYGGQIGQNRKPSSFDAAIADIQKANKEMAKGDPALLKSLWSHEDDVTIFGGVGHSDSKGWKAVETSLNNAGQLHATDVVYTYEPIARQEGTTQGYLIQREHYNFSDGRTADLHVTVLLRKENNVWKIAHRHADILPAERKSDKSSK